nr:hypothetical protein [Tanacetum cinerariifolium]
EDVGMMMIRKDPPLDQTGGRRDEEKVGPLLLAANGSSVLARSNGEQLPKSKQVYNRDSI